MGGALTIAFMIILVSCCGLYAKYKDDKVHAKRKAELKRQWSTPRTGEKVLHLGLEEYRANRQAATQAAAMGYSVEVLDASGKVKIRYTPHRGVRGEIC